jgi:hypothetical protein
MRYSLLLSICLVSIIAPPTVAQERSLDETLDHINSELRDHHYIDYDGQRTVSQVRVARGGLLVVETSKRKAGTEVTNIFEVSLADLDLTRVVARSRDKYVSLSLGARGPVAGRLKCTMAGGTTHEWALPVGDEIAVEFAGKDDVAQDLTVAFRQLVRLARQDTQTST